MGVEEYFTYILELQRLDDIRHSYPLTKRRTEIDLAASLRPESPSFVHKLRGNFALRIDEKINKSYIVFPQIVSSLE